MRRFCETLPEDRILLGNDDLHSVLQKHEGQRIFTVKTTGAKLTYYSAITVLSRYASSLVRATFPECLFSIPNLGTACSNMKTI